MITRSQTAVIPSLKSGESSLKVVIGEDVDLDLDGAVQVYRCRRGGHESVAGVAVGGCQDKLGLARASRKGGVTIRGPDGREVADTQDGVVGGTAGRGGELIGVFVDGCGWAKDGNIG